MSYAAPMATTQTLATTGSLVAPAMSGSYVRAGAGERFTHGQREEFFAWPMVCAACGARARAILASDTLFDVINTDCARSL